jgi:hypothetical protein
MKTADSSLDKSKRKYAKQLKKQTDVTYEEKRALKLISYLNLAIFVVQMLVIAVTTLETKNTNSVFNFYKENTPISL